MPMEASDICRLRFLTIGSV